MELEEDNEIEKRASILLDTSSCPQNSAVLVTEIIYNTH